mmetsp:Transcript_14834/g.23286  ORF Transcript_14834/g.23286 Transcript_14834/m.23286 type:complete len:96 (+) Transcript_14834:386-673(+)
MTMGAVVGNIGQDLKGLNHKTPRDLFWILTDMGEHRMSKICMCVRCEKLIRELHSCWSHAIQTGQGGKGSHRKAMPFYCCYSLFILGTENMRKQS